jgi:hypothetical protein
MKSKWICSLLAGLALGSGAMAQAFSPPPPIEDSQRPVLVYSESEYGKENVNVYLGYKQEGAWKRDTLLSAPFVAVQQLDGPKMLLAAGPSAQSSELFLVDVQQGTSIQVTTRKGHCPITFSQPNARFFRWKEANKAFLLQDGDGASDVEFITVDYAEMTYEGVLLPKSLFGGNFNDQLPVKIAPNGAHIAFMQLVNTPNTTPRTQEYQLRVFHFSDKQVTTVAPRVASQVSENASSPFGVPPFEWYDWETLIYAQTAPVAQGNAADVTFTTTHVHKNEVTALFTQRLPLTEDGGTLFRESPLMAEIIYRPGGKQTEVFVLEPQAGTLMAYSEPTELRFATEGGKVQVSTPTRLLMHKEHFGRRIRGLMSPMRANFAYALSTGADVADKDQQAELYVNLGENEPEKVVGPVYYAKPLVWIE